MDLDTETFSGVYQLEEQREVGAAPTKQIDAGLDHQILEALAGKIAVCNNAHSLRPVGNLPGLRVDSWRQVSTIRPGNAIATPDIVLVDWREQ
jgi:hypothetical protein